MPQYAMKTCALCHIERQLDAFHHRITKTGRLLHGTVCRVCRGVDASGKNIIDKLSFTSTHFTHDFFFLNLLIQEEDEGGSGGWDAEDRARTIIGLLTINAAARSRATKQAQGKKQKTEHETKQKQTKKQAALQRSKQDEQTAEQAKSQEPTEFVFKAAHDKGKAQDGTSALFKAMAATKHAFTRATQSTNINTSQKNTPTQQPTDSNRSNTARQVAQPLTTKPQTTQNPTVQTTTKAETLQITKPIENHEQAFAKTLTFLSPFGMAGTQIRNKATKGATESYMEKMFGASNHTGLSFIQQKTNEEVSQAVEQEKLQETQSRIQNLLKK